jgi:hypothetical protein
MKIEAYATESECQINLPRLHSGQQQVVNESRRFNVLQCGRRFGKTTLGQDRLIHPVISPNDAPPVAWFAPTYKLLSEVWREFKTILAPLDPIISEQERRIGLLTGGVLDFWSLDQPDAGRGRKYKRVVVDEAGLVRNLEAAWNESIRPTLADLKGDAWFLGTPHGRGYFHRLFTKGQSGTDGDWKSWRMPTTANPHIDPAEIEAARRDMPDAAFKQEFLGIPADDGGNPFGLDAIRKCQKSVSSDAPVAFGVDLAKSHDWTVIVGLDEQGNTCRLERFQSDWKQTTRRVAEVIGEVPAYVDSTGVGDPIVEDLCRVCGNVEGFKFTSTSKQQIMEGLAAAIQQHRVTFPGGWLINELEAFEYDYTASGVKYSAPDGLHDDGVCALALAVHCRNRIRLLHGRRGLNGTVQQLNLRPLLRRRPLLRVRLRRYGIPRHAGRTPRTAGRRGPGRGRAARRRIPRQRGHPAAVRQLSRPAHPRRLRPARRLRRVRPRAAAERSGHVGHAGDAGDRAGVELPDLRARPVGTVRDRDRRRRRRREMAKTIKAAAMQDLLPVWDRALPGALECLHFGNWLQEVVWGRREDRGAAGTSENTQTRTVGGYRVVPVDVRPVLPMEAMLHRDAYLRFAGFQIGGRSAGRPMPSSRSTSRTRPGARVQPQPERPAGLVAVDSVRPQRRPHRAQGFGHPHDARHSEQRHDLHQARRHEGNDQRTGDGAAHRQSGRRRQRVHRAADVLRPRVDQGQPRPRGIKAVDVQKFDWGNIGEALAAHLKRLDRLDVNMVRAWHHGEREGMEAEHGAGRTPRRTRAAACSMSRACG